MNILVLLGLVAVSAAYKFPSNFKFGVATAAYQIEGAWNYSGKGENIWDYQTHTFPDLIKDRSNGDIACDSYNQIDEDIKNLKAMKVHYYRFSISWSRILPTGFANKINPDGIRYYNELIDKLIANGIEPMVTIYHWDLPQSIHDLGGWTNPNIVDYFEDYANICYEHFGDRVKTWITINEPYPICQLGYGLSGLAPYIKSDGIGSYLCGHHLILAHARAYNLYKQNYYESQKGKVGITIESTWWEPASDSRDDKDAAERKLQLYFGWFAHPIFSSNGNYHQMMRKRIDEYSTIQGFPRSRLPYFTDSQAESIQGSFDFLGLNHYTTALCEHIEQIANEKPSLNNDASVSCYQDANWETSARDSFKVVPWGLRKLLKWIKDQYNNPEVIITENGYAGFLNETVDDFARISYHNKYLTAVLEAIHEDDCNVTGYTAWSFMDNYEWTDGYTMRFGMHHVDFDDDLRTRTPKKSAFVYQNIIETGEIDEDLIPEYYIH